MLTNDIVSFEQLGPVFFWLKKNKTKKNTILSGAMLFNSFNHKD